MSGCFWRLDKDNGCRTSPDAATYKGHVRVVNWFDHNSPALVDLAKFRDLCGAMYIQLRVKHIAVWQRMLSSFTMRSNFENKLLRVGPRRFWLMGFLAVSTVVSAFTQNKAIDFKEGMPFSNGYVAGNTLYVAGQEGPDANGKLTGTDIAQQTTNAIAAIEKVVKKAGFEMSDIVSVTVYIADLNDVPKMNEIYKKLMPNPKPARATVQVAGLIGGAKIEISAIAVKH
jgi:2-iminobutanoate/2-iminopropanoate deaminase